MRREQNAPGPWLVLSVAVLSAQVMVAGARTAAAQVPPPAVGQCASAPLSCATSAGKLTLDLTTRRLAWKWTAHGVVDVRDLSHPTIDAGFDLCIYDASGVLVMATGVPPAGVCDGKACWRARPWGYQYRDRSALTGGVSKITLHALGRVDRFLVKGEGDLLPLPATAPTLPLTVELVRSDDPVNCWSSTIAELR